MSNEEKHSHHFDLALFSNMSKQFWAPRGLSAEYVQVILVSYKPRRPSGSRDGSSE